MQMPSLRPKQRREAITVSQTELSATFNALRRLIRAVRFGARANAADARLSAAELLVLRRVGDLPGLCISELARGVHTDRSAASVLVSKLASEGLVTRRQAERDARQAAVALTPKGHALLQRQPRLGAIVTARVSKELPRRELDTLARGLVRIARAIKTTNGTGK